MVKQWLEKRKANKRLKKIEKATNIRLTEQQREVVLNPEPPNFTYWGRMSGKSLAACFWVLMWHKGTIDFNKECVKLTSEKRMRLAPTERTPVIPDTDATNYRRLEHLYRMYTRFCLDCIQHGIDVPTVINIGRKQ